MVKSVCVWKTCLSHVTTRTDVTKNVVGVHVNDKKGGYSKVFLYGEASLRGPTPYPFIYPFFRKGTPFVYLLLEKGTLFIYLLKKTYEYIVKTGNLLVIFSRSA